MDLPVLWSTVLAGEEEVVPIITPTLLTELAPQAAATTTPVADTNATTGFSALTLTLSSVESPRTGSTGQYALNGLATTAQGYIQYLHGSGNAIGDWWQYDFWAKAVEPTARIRFYDGSNSAYITSYFALPDWTHYRIAVQAGAQFASARMRWFSQFVDENIQIDDLSIKKISLPTMLAGPKSCEPGNVIASIGLDVPTYQYGGFAINLDSMSNPQNGVFVYHNNVTAYLRKRVAGVWSAVLYSTAITPVSHGILQARNTGTDYQIWYNGTQVGTTQTIADAFTGTIACQYATDSSVGFY